MNTDINIDVFLPQIMLESIFCILKFISNKHAWENRQQWEMKKGGGAVYLQEVKEEKVEKGLEELERWRGKEKDWFNIGSEKEKLDVRIGVEGREREGTNN